MLNFSELLKLEQKSRYFLNNYQLTTLDILGLVHMRVDKRDRMNCFTAVDGSSFKIDSKHVDW